MEAGFDRYNKLCRALEIGDLGKVQDFLNTNEGALTAELNDLGQRSLHVAIGNPKGTQVLGHLLERIDPNQLLLLVDTQQQNALHYAAVLGNTKAANLLVDRNQLLLGRHDQGHYWPIHKAVMNSHEATFKYLLEKHLEKRINPFVGERGAFLLCEIIMAGFLDVAYDVLRCYPVLADTVFPGRQAPLYCIANKRDAYLSAKHYNIYQRFFISILDKYDPLCRALQTGDWENARKLLKLQNLITNENSPSEGHLANVFERIIGKLWEVSILHLPHIKRLKKHKVEHYIALMILKFICKKVGESPSNHEEHYRDAYFKALENDTPEVVEQITRTFPRSILMANDDGYMLSHLSVINRSEKIFNFFVHKVTHNKYLHIVASDDGGNNLLHLAGELTPPHKLNRVAGAALQMQRELQWFEEVKKLMRPKEREAKNSDDQTPIMVFRDKHANLEQKGEAWTKKVADSYVITAALMITIVFAAIINVPGGIKENTGKPTFQTMPSFMVFLVSDAISLFTATVSLMFFLSILTARHSEKDFLYTIPTKLICGLLMLCISVTAMLIAFSATLLIMFTQDTSLHVMIIISIIACVLILAFIAFQLPLLVDLISSTYGRGIF